MDFTGTFFTIEELGAAVRFFVNLDAVIVVTGCYKRVTSNAHIYIK